MVKTLLHTKFLQPEWILNEFTNVRELNFYRCQVYACLLHMNLSFLKAKKMIS